MPLEFLPAFWAFDRVYFRLVARDRDGQIAALAPAVDRTLQMLPLGADGRRVPLEKTPDPGPTLVLDRKTVQALVDDLARLGFRPTDPGGPHGTLLALDRVIEAQAAAISHLISRRSDPTPGEAP